MSDLISIENLKESLIKCDGLGRKSLEAVLKTINEQPTIEAVPVVHGEWIKAGRISARCSECNYLTLEIEANFCPDCGANMRKGGVKWQP